MKALLVEQFRQKPKVSRVNDPDCSKDGVILEVKSTGLCRSDWHGWMGHDHDIALPHVPGHEFSGVIAEVGSEVKNWKVGDRVTAPFVCACGTCPTCQSGNQQICDFQFQPGFTHWGSFAEYVAVFRADTNLIELSDEISFDAAAALGCRFATSYRGVVAQGKVKGGEFVAVHGCGGVGLSAIMIATALGAIVIAVDISEDKLAMAKAAGANFTINGAFKNVPESIHEITKGGAHVSIDALGSKVTSWNSVASLQKRGKHIQIGLLAGDEANPEIPMHLVVANELEILGSHGMQAHAYPEMIEMINIGKLKPQKLIGSSISLDQAVEALPNLGEFQDQGMLMINRFN